MFLITHCVRPIIEHYVYNSHVVYDTLSPAPLIKPGCSYYGHCFYWLLQSDIGHTMKNFITLISNPPTKIMVIGPMFTPEAKVIAQTSALYNLVEVMALLI